MKSQARRGVKQDQILKEKPRYETKSSSVTSSVNFRASLLERGRPWFLAEGFGMLPAALLASPP